MAEVKADQEPSIEEILESIRQIISEDVDSGAKPAVMTAPPPPPLQPSSVPTPPPAAPKQAAKVEAPVLDLTDRLNPSSVAVEIEMMDSPMTNDTDSLLSPPTADAATETLSKLLMGNVAIEKEEIGRPGKVTLEEMTRSLMKPMLKLWLDQNLPGIVEKIVQKEVDKLARRTLDR